MSQDGVGWRVGGKFSRKRDKLSPRYFTPVTILLLFLVPSYGSRLRSQMKMLVSSKTLNIRHFKPGVAVDALPDAIHYNKYIPLIFQLRVPEWSMDTLRLNNSFHCFSDSIKQNPLCPVAYHMDRLLSPIADSMRFAKNIYTPTEGWSFFGKFSCELIEPHFFHLSAHVDELHLYTDKMKQQCPLAKNTNPIVKNITLLASQHVITASNKFYSHMVENFKDVNESKMVQMAGYVGFQTAYLLTQYVDTVRWNNAFTQCQASRLSIGLVNSFWLRNALNPIQKIAENNGYKLSIPVHEYLPHYYKLALTDCVLGIQSTKRTTLMMRLLVPVQKKDTKYTRFRLTKIPYLVMEGAQKKICEIDSFDPKDDFLLEEAIGMPGGRPVVTVAPDCFESDLCHISEQPRSLVVDPCLKGLLNGSVDHIRDHCSFECFSIDNEDLILPMIIRVGPNQYSITGGHKTKPISVYCDGQKSHVLEPNKTNGVMQVILPCNCEIRFKSEVYRSFHPCDQPFEAHYLTSVPFKVVFAGQPPSTERIGDKIEPPSELEKENEVKELKNELKSETEGEIPDQIVPANWVLPAELVEEDKNATQLPPPSSHGGQLAMIWVLLILLVISNGFLIYVAYANRHIDLGGIREAMTRLGISTSRPRRNRLEEEPPSYSATTATTTSTPTTSTTTSTGQNGLQISSSQQMPDNTLWPASLNRL